MAEIKDSGARRKFETGAVRDIQEGKGRCDLLPLDVVTDLFDRAVNRDENMVIVFDHINRFKVDGDVACLTHALGKFGNERWGKCTTMLLEVSKHFEDGAKKYGDRNWEKGIPVHCYIDSAVRHYIKFIRGDDDEPHDRAFCWNIMCAIWTCWHHPELNDMKPGNEIKAECGQKAAAENSVSCGSASDVAAFWEGR